MTLLAPIGLAALAVPVAIYVIHWLFGARRRLRVPAVFLWRNLPQASSGRSKRHLPPFTLLLLLQLLAALAGVAALARPTTPADPPRHVAVILDASASMQATDVLPTRFDAARQSALQRLGTLRPTDLVSVIRAGKQATLLGSGPPDSAKPLVRGAQPGDTKPSIREALALASTRVSETPDRRGQILVFTDVAWTTPDPTGSLAAPVEIIPTGGGSNNQAISALVVRMDPNGRGQTAFVEVTNESYDPVRAPIRVSADGAPLDERQVTIAPRTRIQLSIPMPTDAHHVTAQLLGKDALALDDQLDTVAPGGPPRDVDLLGRVSDGLRRAVESIPSMHVRTADAPQPPDLSVLAGVLPPQLPAGPLLIVDPPADSARLVGVGLGSGARVESSHPLLQGLDLAAFEDASPTVSSVPGWAHVVLGTVQGPLIMEGRLEGRPVVSLTFDPALSGMEKSLAFPLLVSNATSFLLSQAEKSQQTPAVEPFDSVESDIGPRPVPTFAATLTPDQPSAGSNQIWPWFAAGALGLLGLEWLAFARHG